VYTQGFFRIAGIAVNLITQITHTSPSDLFTLLKLFAEIFSI